MSKSTDSARSTAAPRSNGWQRPVDRLPRPASVPATHPLSPDPADPPDEPALPQTGLEADPTEAQSTQAKPDSGGRGKRRPERDKWPLATPRRPGRSATTRDVAITKAILAEQARRERPDLGEAEVDKLAEDRLLDLTRDPHPRLGREYARLSQSSWCPSRRDIRDHVEVRSLRQLREIGWLEELLASYDHGRPSERRLAVATFMRLAMGDCRPEVRAAVKDFAGSNAELDWAYFDSVAANDISPHIRDETTVRRVLKGMLERHDPEIAVELNMSLVNQLARNHDDPFKYLVIDATPIEAHLEQGGDVSATHGKLMNRGTGAKFGHHAGRNRKPKSWRGWKLLVLGSIKLGLGLVAQLVPASEPEFPYVLRLLERFFGLVDPSLLPSDEIYLVGDSEYDRKTRLAFDLQQRFGVIPVFDLRKTVGKEWDWAASDGVPHCAKHGPMKRLWGEDFFPVSVPLRYEPDFAKAKKEYEARIRWQCSECKKAGHSVRANTWVRKNARIYTFLPRGGDHWLFATRLALMLKRNCIEGLFSQLKLRGIGGRNHFRAKWVSRQPHMEWVCYAGLLAMTARRRAHETGLYAASVADAQRLQLAKVPLQVPANAISIRQAREKAAARKRTGAGAGGGSGRRKAA